MLPWRLQARPEQLAPAGNWRTWYVRGGRGSGKTRTGSETLKEWIEANPGHEWAAVAPTFGDARDVCIEGPSGLLRAFGLSRGFRGWNRSYGELFLPDGSTVYCDGADDGALRIQGRNLAGLWADEVGLWKQWRLAWEESIAYAVRIDPARIVATGTPKRGHPLVKRLLHDATIPTTRLRTMDNAANLSRLALDDLQQRYAGTDLGRQELEGEELTEVAGALVTREMIEYREPPMIAVKGTLVPHFTDGCVAVDPAVTSGLDSDETGILVCGKGADNNGYVIDDQSGHYTPDGWARRAIGAATDNGFDTIVGEVNNGGDLVEHTIRSAGWKGRFVRVSATRGKMVRAQPVAAGYERNLHNPAGAFQVFHTRPFPELEDQWVSTTPDSTDSPDRLDAEVWGFHHLLLLGRVAVTDVSMANV